MEQMKTRIDLQPLTDEAIEDLSFGMDDLWMIKSMDTIFGPFDTNSLRDYAQTHQYLFEDAYAQNFQHQEWKPFFHFVQFQRRVPKLVPAQSLISNDNFLIVQGGQKEGPYTLDELKVKVNAGAVSVRSEVSVDNGKTWIKLYEHHEFDRRTRSKQGDLPFTPKEESFKGSESFALKRMQERQQNQDEEDALVGLAFVGSGNDKGQKVKSLSRKKEVEVKPTTPKFQEPKVSSDGAVKKFNTARFLAGVTFFAFIGGYVLLNNEPDKVANTPVKTTSPKTLTKNIDNSERSVTTKTQTESRRRPASIKRMEPARVEIPRHEMKHKRPTWKPTNRLKIDDPRVRAEIERERSVASEDNYYDNEDPRDSYRDPRESSSPGEPGNSVSPSQGERFNPDAYQNEQDVQDYEERRDEAGYQEVQDFE